MPKIQNFHGSNQTQKGNIGSYCESNKDCLDNLECLKTSLSLENGFCTLLQCDILNCPENTKCITLPGNIHACASLCKENENCDTLSICTNTESFFPAVRSMKCSAKANCNADEICFNEQCYTSCNSVNDCLENEQCLGYSDNKGKQIRLCSESEKVCKPKDYGLSCHSHAECGNCGQGGDSLCEYIFGKEYKCDISNFTCQKPCAQNDTTCPSIKKYCDMNSQTCVPLCQKDQDCVQPEKCNLKSGQCEKSCNSNEQCHEKEFCDESKICEPRSCKSIGCSSVLYSCNQGNNALTQEQCLPHCGNIFSQTSTISSKEKCPTGFVCSNFGICIHEN